MKTRLGRQESMFLAYTQMRKLRVVRTGEMVKALKLNRTQERDLFHRLSQGRMIARLRRGAYLVPPRLPLGGSWTPNEAEAINALMAESNGRYQICGQNTFNRYGFDGQIPNRVYVYNNRLSGTRIVGAVTMTLIKVKDARLGEQEIIKTLDGDKVYYSSRVRSLVDAVYDWSRFNGIPRGYDWIREELQAKRVLPKDLVRVTIRFGDLRTIRRMGMLLEKEGVSKVLLQKLDRVKGDVAVPILFVPRRAKNGELNRRWGVVDNEVAGPRK